MVRQADGSERQAHLPVSTYRIQFNPFFRFSSARAILDYLFSLGIGDIYASPVFKAREGSTHGYDIVDPQAINPELGSREDFLGLIHETKKKGMGWLQDIVPNHMAFDSSNKELMDVLEKGDASEYFDFFDIDWNHQYESLKGRLLCPFLGEFYSESLETGAVKLVYDEYGLAVRYYNLRLPLRLSSYQRVFLRDFERVQQEMRGSAELTRFMGVLRVFESFAPLPARHRYDHVAHAKSMLWELYTRDPMIGKFMDSNIDAFNGRPGEPESFNALDELMLEQLFRLSFWKVAAEEINYRRFFTINDLISVRVEKDAIFEYSHRLILECIREGLWDGLRVDHVDGLYDPLAYLNRLRTFSPSLYLVVEKILSTSESVPSNWPVDGTTGYDFMNAVNGLFCDKSAEADFTRIFYGFTAFNTAYSDLVADRKRLIIGKYMAGNIDNLATSMKMIASNARYGRDITLYGLRRALVEIAAFFPVYRTYISEGVFTEDDKRVLHEAVARSMQASPGLTHELLFIERFLFLNFFDRFTSEKHRDFLDFVMKFQQFTAPITAKGFEDTVLYLYNRLISLNEVGSEPAVFGASDSEFHAFCLRRAQGNPNSMNATSTHDTKRGEDARALINVLSEFPDLWGEKVNRWREINSPKKHRSNGREMPDANDEYALYQALIGSFPFEEAEFQEFTERIRQYIIKSVREAKAHTAWIKPDAEYEKACLGFVDRLLAFEPGNAFLDDFLPFQRRIAFYGIFNSLAQLVLKVACPGIPDFYQGSELWSQQLVDPDSRRSVDFEKRRKYLKEIMREDSRDIRSLIKTLWSQRENGKIKLFISYRSLRLRRNQPLLFSRGEYIPLTAEGSCAGNIFAFARRLNKRFIICAVPRFVSRITSYPDLPLGEAWRDTRLILPPEFPSEWRNEFSDLSVYVRDNLLPAAEIFNDIIPALLVSK